MDESAVRAIVDANIKRLMDELGLGHWRIKCRYEPTGTPDWLAMSTVDPDYNMATFTFDPAMHEDEAEVISSIEHELYHVALAPFVLYRETLREQAPPDDDRFMRAEQRAWRYAVEQGVINLERIVRLSRTKAASVEG